MTPEPRTDLERVQALNGPDWQPDSEGGRGWVRLAAVEMILDATHSPETMTDTPRAAQEPAEREAGVLRSAIERLHSYCANGCDRDPDGVRRFRNNAFEDEECIDSIHPAADEVARLAAIPASDNEPGRLSDAEVETIYAAYDKVLCQESRTLEGKREIVEPLYRAVVQARVNTALAARRRSPVPASDPEGQNR